MISWVDVMLGYAAYLAALAWLRPRFRAARPFAGVMFGAALILRWWWRMDGDPTTASGPTWVVVPSLALLGAYRVSGVFFVKPSERLESLLLAIDDVLLMETGVLRTYRAAAAPVRETFELFYLLVYAVVPAGAVVLLAGGRADALGAYWTTVFGAELGCYAALPWLQSRPPRALEPARAVAAAARKLNLWLLRYGSIQCNTFPSAHAAGAAAVALAVYSAMPSAGSVLLVVAVGITLATMLGRYHYALDSILGVAVAILIWVLVSDT
jgi:membrane-associated phospholipid phosphatase